MTGNLSDSAKKKFLKETVSRYITPAAYTAVFLIISYILGSDTLCYLKTITGLPCPGCGLTRSYIHLFHGDIYMAFYYHPLFVLPPVIFAIWLIKEKRPVCKIYKSTVYWFSLVFIFLGVWITRLVLMFPSKEPMDFNRNGFLPLLIDFIKKNP